MATGGHVEKTKGSRNLNNIAFLTNLRAKNPFVTRSAKTEQVPKNEKKKLLSILKVLHSTYRMSYWTLAYARALKSYER